MLPTFDSAAQNKLFNAAPRWMSRHVVTDAPVPENITVALRVHGRFPSLGGRLHHAGWYLRLGMRRLNLVRQ